VSTGTDIEKRDEATPAKGTPDRPFDLMLDFTAADYLFRNMSKGADKTIAKALLRETREVAAQLAGPDPSPIERSLAVTAALCWCDLRYRECLDYMSTDRTIVQADHADRRLDHSHRRYVSALKTLAQVRRLALPALQVNIGQNQVNTVGTTP
jgi:hypothetical protein